MRPFHRRGGTRLGTGQGQQLRHQALLRLAGDLIDPKAPMGRKILSLLRSGAYYAYWYPKLFLGWGRAPRYGEFADPVVTDGRVEAEVLASAVHVIVRTIAAGRHYSSAVEPPFVPGLDGVVRLPDGRRVYAAGVQAPYGMLAERAAVPLRAAVDVPEGVSDATAAAIVNPAASSWLPLSRVGAEGATVLVHGATGTSGLLAVQVARALGASRVVAAGRNAEGLARAAELGLDDGEKIAMERRETPTRGRALTISGRREGLLGSVPI